MPESPRSARALTALAVLAGAAALFAAWKIPASFALDWDWYLRPNWISFGYPQDVVAPGKLRQYLIFFAASLFGLAGGWLLSGPLDRVALKRRSSFAAALVALSAVLAAVIVHFGNRQFGAIDESVAIDVGWRLFNGQQPYRDFICTIPVGFYLPPGWAFRLLGPAWSSLVALTAAFGVVTFVWQALLLRRLTTSPVWALLLAFAFQSLAVVIASFWWYNPLTNISAITLLLSALFLLREPESWFGRVSYVLALIILAAMKPNVALLTIAGATIVLLTSKRHRLVVVLCSAIAFALFVAGLALNHISLFDLLGSYLSIAKRANPSPMLSFNDFNLAERLMAGFTVLLAVWPVFGRRGKSGDWRLRVLLTLSWLTGVYTMLSHGEMKFLELPFLLVATTLPVFAVDGDPTARRRTATICIALTVIALTIGAMRHRIEKIGFGAFFEWNTVDVAPKNEFFRSLRTGPRFHDVLAQIEQLRRENPGKRIFYTIRLESMYAATGQQSPRGMPPLLWHRNTLHPQSMEPRIVKNFRDQNFDLVVCLFADFTHMPPDFENEFARRYRYSEEHALRFSELTVLVRRAQPGPRMPF